MSKFKIDPSQFESLQGFVSAFSGKGDCVRVTASKSGVSFRFNEDGVLGVCSLPVMASEFGEFYIKHTVLSNILSNSTSKEIDFHLKDENLIQVTIDGVLLNISPEFYNGIQFDLPKMPDTANLSLNASRLSEICKLVSTQATSDSHVTPVMKIGSTWRYGTSTNITLLDVPESKEVNWTVNSNFIKYMDKLTKLNDQVSFFKVDGEHESYLIVTSLYNTFWTSLASIEPNDISDFLEEEIEANATLNNTKEIMSTLDKLFIPLIGSVDEPHVTLTLKEKSIKFQVVDLGNRVSMDTKEVISGEDYDEAIDLNFLAFQNAVKKLTNGTNVSVKVKETCVIFSQEGMHGESNETGNLTLIINRYI